jgi:hypothetical protein
MKASVGSLLLNRNLQIPRDRIAEFCKRNHIVRLAVFGSALRADFGPDSDVDVLVEFEKDHTPGFAFFQMQDELSDMIGRHVDLCTPNFLSRYFRDEVMRQAEVQYVQ